MANLEILKAKHILVTLISWHEVSVDAGSKKYFARDLMEAKKFINSENHDEPNTIISNLRLEIRNMLGWFEKEINESNKNEFEIDIKFARRVLLK